MEWKAEPYGTEVQAPRKSPLDALSSAIGHLEKARAMAGELANTMVGPVPTSVGNKDAISTGGGLIEQIERYAASINSMAASIIEDMDRVQRRL